MNHRCEIRTVFRGVTYKKANSTEIEAGLLLLKLVYSFINFVMLPSQLYQKGSQLASQLTSQVTSQLTACLLRQCPNSIAKSMCTYMYVQLQLCMRNNIYIQFQIFQAAVYSRPRHAMQCGENCYLPSQLASYLSLLLFTSLAYIFLTGIHSMQC